MVGREHLITLFKPCEGLGFPGVCLLRLSEKENQVQTALSAPKKGTE